jgi:hypothetical protein
MNFRNPLLKINDFDKQRMFMNTKMQTCGLERYNLLFTILSVEMPSNGAR